MWVKAWVKSPPEHFRFEQKTIHLDLFVGTDWPVGNSKKTGPVAVRRASAKRVATEMRSAGKPASGPVLVSSLRPFGQAGRSGSRSCPRAWGLSPWGDTVVRVDAGHHRC